MDQPKITQAMIEAYDEYTHLTLDRRDFMRKLRQLAGSGAAAAAIAPLLAANGAQAETIAADDARLETSDITYKGSSGDVGAYLAMPKGAAKLPTVIVIHENRGLNPHVRDVARRLALEGFVAMAPDLLSPAGGTPQDEDVARELISALDQTVTSANLSAAVDYLKSHEHSTGKVGAVGFCWGGGQVNRLAVIAPDLKAGVAYYGAQVPAEDVPKISAALLLHYAGLDDRINKGIEAYKAALEANKKDFAIHVYDGVNHAFNNDTAKARYDKAAAELAWGRTVEFLKAKLG